MVADPSLGSNMTGYVTFEYDPANPSDYSIADWSFTSGVYTLDPGDANGLTNYPPNFESTDDLNVTGW